MSLEKSMWTDALVVVHRSIAERNPNLDVLSTASPPAPPQHRSRRWCCSSSKTARLEPMAEDVQTWSFQSTTTRRPGD